MTRGVARGEKPPRQWTDEEEGILTSNYRKLPISKMKELLPGRSEGAIMQRMSMLYGNSSVKKKKLTPPVIEPKVVEPSTQQGDDDASISPQERRYKETAKRCRLHLADLHREHPDRIPQGVAL